MRLLIEDGRGTTSTRLYNSVWLRGLEPPSPHPLGVTAAKILSSEFDMKIEQFAGHHEARDALVLSVAGVTAIMLIESLILLILY